MARIQFTSTGLEPILSHTENSCITSYYRQFSKNTKKIIQLVPVLLAQAFGSSIATYMVLIDNFNIRGQLSII